MEQALGLSPRKTLEKQCGAHLGTGPGKAEVTTRFSHQVYPSLAQGQSLDVCCSEPPASLCTCTFCSWWHWKRKGFHISDIVFWWPLRQGKDGLVEPLQHVLCAPFIDGESESSGGGEQSNVHGGSADAPPERHFCWFSLPTGRNREGSLLFPSPPLIKLEISPSNPLQIYWKQEVVPGGRGSGMLWGQKQLWGQATGLLKSR